MTAAAIAFTPTSVPGVSRCVLRGRAFQVQRIREDSALRWSPGWAIDEEIHEDRQRVLLRLVSGLADLGAVRRWLSNETGTTTQGG